MDRKRANYRYVGILPTLVPISVVTTSWRLRLFRRAISDRSYISPSCHSMKITGETLIVRQESSIRKIFNRLTAVLA